jgi:hypothetical protein
MRFVRPKREEQDSNCSKKQCCPPTGSTGGVVRVPRSFIQMATLCLSTQLADTLADAQQRSMLSPLSFPAELSTTKALDDPKGVDGKQKNRQEKECRK